MSLQGQDKQSHSQATSLLGKGDTQEHPVSVTACSAAPRICGSHPSDGVWERLPGTVWGGGLGLAAMTYRTLEDQAALTLKLARSVIWPASGCHWACLCPGFCLRICVTWRKGLACGQQALTHVHGEGWQVYPAPSGALFQKKAFPLVGKLGRKAG